MTTTLEIEPLRTPESPETPDGWSLVTTLDGLAPLEPTWRALADQVGGPIEQFDWALASATADKRRDPLHVAAHHRGGCLVALAPMTVGRLHGVRRSVMLGVEEHREPMDLLVGDARAATELAEALARRRLPTIFGRLPAESLSVEPLRRAFGRQGLVIERTQPATPFISLDDTWTDPDQRLNSRRRSDLRRARRRAEKLGHVDVKVLTPAPDEVDALFDAAAAVEARSWKGAEGTAMTCDPRGAARTRAYAHMASRQGSLRIGFLRIDGYPIAMQVAMVQSGGFWLLKIGYDSQFAHCSPGILLLRETIAYAAQSGLASYQFLGQDEPWIAMWTGDKRQCVALYAYPYNLRGGAALAADITVKAARSVRNAAATFGRRLRTTAKTCATPLIKRAARNYIAGDTLDDAMRVRDRLATHDRAATIGFWDNASQNAQAVADQYLAGLDRLADDPSDTYLSIKLPALRFSQSLLADVGRRACRRGRRVHFDSLAPDIADRTKAMADDLLKTTPGVDIGFTLPGRWQRSLDDAVWVCNRGLYVRVVKGEWVDPDAPQRDPHDGFLEVIDRLAGNAARVGVATHDPQLAAEALGRLQAAGTPCELELLHGLPMHRAIEQARRIGVGVRIYVPYGEAYMPYALGQVRRKPHVLWWLTKDLIATAFRRERS